MNKLCSLCEGQVSSMKQAVKGMDENLFNLLEQMLVNNDFSRDNFDLLCFKNGTWTEQEKKKSIEQQEKNFQAISGVANLIKNLKKKCLKGECADEYKYDCEYCKKEITTEKIVTVYPKKGDSPFYLCFKCRELHHKNEKAESMK